MNFKKSITYKWLKSSYKKIAKKEGISIAELKRRIREEAWEVFRLYNFQNPAISYSVYELFQGMYNSRKAKSWEKLLHQNDSFQKVHNRYKMGDDAWKQMKYRLFKYDNNKYITHYQNKPLLSLSAEEIDEVRYMLKNHEPLDYSPSVYHAITEKKDFMKKLTGNKEEKLSIFIKFLKMHNMANLPVNEMHYCRFNFKILDFLTFISQNFHNQFTFKVAEKKEGSAKDIFKLHSPYYKVTGTLFYKNKVIKFFEKPVTILQDDNIEERKSIIHFYYYQFVQKYIDDELSKQAQEASE